MNASMARRIRNAETVLISAIDRQKDDRRKSTSLSETGRFPQNSPGFSVLIRDEHGVAHWNRPLAGLRRPSCLG
ncbi:MAG TPA: hypothetical protein VFQ79_23465 [Bryobacteraceae bacterium]|nr:hypothetical protein [Bryobacteraceae bacterium]